MSDKEATNVSDKDRLAKKLKVNLKQSSIGNFLDSSKCFRTNKKTGRIETFKVTAGSDLVGDKHKCKHCEKTFKTAKVVWIPKVQSPYMSWQ
jgi:aspartate carbamoyltransferase regulatory subunit